MNGWNRPTVLPYQPTTWESFTRPLLTQLGTMALGMKMQQSYRTKQAEAAKLQQEELLAKTGILENVLRPPVPKQGTPQALGQIPGVQSGALNLPATRVSTEGPLVTLGGKQYEVTPPSVKQIMVNGVPLAGQYMYRHGKTEKILNVKPEETVSVAKEGDSLRPGTVYAKDADSKIRILQQPEKTIQRIQDESAAARAPAKPTYFTGATGEVTPVTTGMEGPQVGPSLGVIGKPSPKEGWKPTTKAEAIEVKKAGLQPQAALQNLETLVMPDGTEKTFRRGDPMLDTSITAGGVKRVVGRTPQDVIQKKEFQDLRAQEVATRDVLALAGELERAAIEDPTILGMVGTSQRAIDRVANQMVAASKALGGKAFLKGKQVNEIELLNPEHYNLTGFGESAAKSAGFKSTVLRLAYTIARSQEPGSGRFSDRDVQNAINQIAGSQGSLPQLQAALNAVRRNTVISYSNRYRVTQGKEMPADMFGINIGQIQQPKIIRYDAQGNRIQ